MCSPRIYWASVGRYTKCDYYQERMSSRWRDDAKPFSRAASFQGTPVHKDSAMTAPTARSANRSCAIASSLPCARDRFSKHLDSRNSMLPKAAGYCASTRVNGRFLDWQTAGLGHLETFGTDAKIPRKQSPAGGREPPTER